MKKNTIIQLFVNEDLEDSLVRFVDLTKKSKTNLEDVPHFKNAKIIAGWDEKIDYPQYFDGFSKYENLKLLAFTIVG